MIKNKKVLIMKKTNTFWLVAMIFAAPLFLGSCATIVSGGDPSITIHGNVPEPVTIKTEKQTYPEVILPTVVQIDRHHLKGQRIQITSDNYMYDDIVLGKSTNGWAFGNILLGGIIGLGVDLLTNCVSKPTYTHFDITPLPKNPSEATKEDNNE